MTIEVHQGSADVYTDIGLRDADEMIIKAQLLVVQVAMAIKSRKFSLEHNF